MTEFGFNTLLVLKVVSAPKSHTYEVIDSEVWAKVLRIHNLQLKLDKFWCVASEVPLDFFVQNELLTISLTHNFHLKGVQNNHFSELLASQIFKPDHLSVVLSFISIIRFFAV